jgi:transglutaminase-like putative cysteine protease
MKLTVNHTTHYNYGVPASYALQQLRIRPQASPSQTVTQWQMQLEGAETQASFTDQHGNVVDLVEFLPDTQDVSLTVSGEIETFDTAGVQGLHTSLMPLWCYLNQTPLTAAGKHVRAIADDIRSDEAKTDDISRLHALSARILEHAKYQQSGASVDTTAEAALERGSGVCQDHAHIFLSVARLLGFPARYVSGYLMMSDRIDQDASHAWAEVHIDGLGWVGFDVSNEISPDERYVHIARGLDYRECAPTTGFIMGAAQEKLVVSLQVQQ